MDIERKKILSLKSPTPEIKELTVLKNMAPKETWSEHYAQLRYFLTMDLSMSQTT